MDRFELVGILFLLTFASCNSSSSGGRTDSVETQDIVNTVSDSETGANSETETDDEVAPTGIVFEVDDGYRLNFASNPRVISYSEAEGTLGLGYEYRSQELRENPGERGYIAFTDDGLNFTGSRRFEPGEQAGPGTLLADGTYRRFFFSPDQCGFISDYSEDGVHFEPEDGIRLELSHDNCQAGVYTNFVDAEGDVVLLYNGDQEDEATGQMTIYVREARSTDNGVSFTFEDDDLLEQTDDLGRAMSLADPNALVLADGRVLLVVMYQDIDEPKPPLGRTGDIYGFVSEDGTSEFEPLGNLISWSSFDDFEVRSLNDPKIFQFADGTLKIYIAAMIPVETGEEYDNEHKYVIVSATATNL